MGIVDQNPEQGFLKTWATSLLLSVVVALILFVNSLLPVELNEGDVARVVAGCVICLNKDPLNKLETPKTGWFGFVCYFQSGLDCSF